MGMNKKLSQELLFQILLLLLGIVRIPYVRIAKAS